MSFRKSLVKSGESGPRFRLCLPPCKRYITSGDTHSMCVVCLGAEHAMTALERADCPHCELLPLQVLRSRKALFEEGAFTSVPQGAGPASAEAERALHSWGSQMDLLEGMETGDPLSPSLPDRSDARSEGSEARTAATSSQGTGSSLHLSSSEEGNLESAVEEPLPQSPQYEELLEVVTRAVEKLNIDWPAEKKAAPQKSKLDERFLRSKPPPPTRSLPFFPDLHAEISRSWERPLLARFFVPASDYYRNAYQADLLKGLAEGEKVDLEELQSRSSSPCHQGDCPGSRAVYGSHGGGGEASMVDPVRQKEKNRVFLLDAPLQPSGLFGDAVDSVVSRYQEAHKQAAAFQRFLPRRSLDSTAAGREQSSPCTSSSYREIQKLSVATRAPPSRDRDPRHSRPGSSKARPDLRVVLQSRRPLATKKDGGLRPIIDLRRLNRSVMKLKFKMLTVKQVVSQIRSEDWFVTIDLKDAYFHVSILPQHRKFLRFAFRGEAYQYRVLPFGLALSPRTFTKCVDAALVPLRLQGIRTLNYIDDWLILAASESLAARHQDVVLAHIKMLGLRLNAKKSVLFPSQRTTYLGVVWDSTTMQAHLSPARIESILAAVKRVKEGQSLTVKQFQQLLGLMAAASSVIPFGLLYMRPLQWWLKTRGFSPRGNPFRMIKVTRRGLRALDMWRKPWFLNQGLVLGARCRRITLTTDASLTGWGRS
ncbi:Transposon Ty3-G Gag-Pol polyprotein [Labeo rohita]|uniref:ribonuclease H n=1 Tax=Labeo rohita TaxID=84645 RepID=A0ABQ8L625_LABRO|nr:Transposon Ty3-G Gag-Pol polyprotein [Labeo rohita]